MYLTARASGDSASLAKLLQTEVHALDPALPVYDVKPMADWLQASEASRRLTAALFLAFGVLALVLAGIGTYGVMAYAVEQRTQEIGIRIALGASRVSVLRMVVAEAMRLGLAGVALGGTLAFLAASAISTLLFGVKEHDPVTFAGVCVTLVAVAFVAAIIPAHRATRVGPMQAMRMD